MSRRRYLSTTISRDKQVNRLAMECSDFAALLYTWMIPHAGDDGTVNGDPEELLMEIVPGRRDKSPEDITTALEGMEELGLITWDRSEGRIAFPPSFYKHQRGLISRIRRKPWVRLRNKARPRIFERDGHRCRRCGATEYLEVDHIVPIARGGFNDDDNLQTLCRPCNRRKWAS